MTTVSHRPLSLKFGRSPHNPGEAIKESKALAPSRVWSPGRRGPTDLGSRRPPSFDPTNCWPISDRSHTHRTNPTKEPR
jgi:hypothetical protein